MQAHLNIKQKSVELQVVDVEKEQISVKTLSAKKALLQELRKKEENSLFRQFFRATIILDDSMTQNIIVSPYFTMRWID